MQSISKIVGIGLHFEFSSFVRAFVLQGAPLYFISLSHIAGEIVIRGKKKDVASGERSILKLKFRNVKRISKVGLTIKRLLALRVKLERTRGSLSTKAFSHLLASDFVMGSHNSLLKS